MPRIKQIPEVVPFYGEDELKSLRWRVTADRVTAAVLAPFSAACLFKAGYEMGQGDTGDMLKALGLCAVGGIMALGRGLRAQEDAPQIAADTKFWQSLNEGEQY